MSPKVAISAAIAVLSALEWQKSSFSGGDGCVEVAPFRDGLVAVRDSKDPSGPVLMYNEKEWSAFLAGARNSEFDDLPQRSMHRSIDG